MAPALEMTTAIKLHNILFELMVFKRKFTYIQISSKVFLSSPYYFLN